MGIFLFVGFSLGTIIGGSSVLAIIIVIFLYPIPKDFQSHNNIQNITQNQIDNRFTSMPPPQPNAKYTRHIPDLIDKYKSPDVIPILNMFSAQECALIIEKLEQTKLTEGRIKHGDEATLAKSGGVDVRT